MTTNAVSHFFSFFEAVSSRRHYQLSVVVVLTCSNSTRRERRKEETIQAEFVFSSLFLPSHIPHHSCCILIAQNVAKSMSTMIVSNPKPVATKSARFHNTVFIKEIPSARTYSMLEKRLCWYTNDDYRSFKLNMFLERSTLTFPHPVDNNDDDTKIQVHRRTGIDQSPDIPRRSVSPNRERIRSELPSPPLYTNPSFDDDSSLEEAPTEQQILKAKSMRERLRQLRDEQQQQREVQSTSRSPPSFRNKYGERQTICQSDPLDMSVRQYVPFPEDDDDDENSKPVRTVTIKNILPKHYAFQHPQCSRSSPYYPTKSLSQAVQVVAGGNRGNIESILDSVLSTVASS